MMRLWVWIVADYDKILRNNTMFFFFKSGNGIHSLVGQHKKQSPLSLFLWKRGKRTIIMKFLHWYYCFQNIARLKNYVNSAWIAVYVKSFNTILVHVSTWLKEDNGKWWNHRRNHQVAMMTKNVGTFLQKRLCKQSTTG